MISGWAAEARQAVYGRCREMRIEPPSAGRIERLVGSAMRTHDQRFCEAIFAKLSPRA
jgi:hypothetical protein